MAESPVKESDIPALLAIVFGSVGPIHVDAEKVAQHLGISLATVPPKFTALRKRYNLEIKVINSGALQRNRPNSPKKRLAVQGPKPMRNTSVPTQSGSDTEVNLPEELLFEPAAAVKQEGA
ncbi:hypothetical protein AYL99_08511 [Fonsecaea erecta]|uniref:Uncharacterized protein n=1 Tax=Fonsecaea erecta TaxID=1367422 RepID=A0A178ZF16_9EURO|nr:hypothetical protein AYL99_08511 [Fonsecaea erecta]OAP57773.1 hypothetical protein AYL99_08511 [Fonsecaea erecta]